MSNAIKTPEAKYTKLPWHIGEYGTVKDASGEQIVVSGFSLAMGGSWPEVKGNTSLIVRAVNSHSKLVTLVDQLLTGLAYASGCKSVDEFCRHHAIGEQARAALSLATQPEQSK